MAAPAKSGGGGSKVSEVDFDRLWRDRVSQELTYQRQWVEEYGFMVDEPTRERLRAGSVSMSSKQLDGAASLKKSKTGTLYQATPVVGVMTSTQQASFKVLPSPEIKNDPSPHRRRKFVDN